MSLVATRLQKLAQQAVRGRQIVFCLGGPGSGKGSVCEKLAARHEHYGWATLSVGELLRRAATDDDALRRGEIVPPERSASLLLNELVKMKNDVKVAIIDGFPRNLNAALLWDRLLPNANTCALLLSVHESTLRKRLVFRGRMDDNSDTVDKRIELHKKLAPQLFDYLAADGRAVEVDGNGTIDEVVRDVEYVLSKPPFSLDVDVVNSQVISQHISNIAR